MKCKKYNNKCVLWALLNGTTLSLKCTQGLNDEIIPLDQEFSSSYDSNLYTGRIDPIKSMCVAHRIFAIAGAVGKLYRPVGSYLTAEWLMDLMFSE